jgi:hypothetical protein
MNPEITEALRFVGDIFPAIAVIVAASIGGWLFNNWMRIKHGYPLDGAWGQPIHPKTDREAAERIKLLTQENAQLRAELGSVKDRLETIERIITDQPSKLALEIDALRVDKGGRA